MKPICLTILAVIISCSSEQRQSDPIDRFSESLLSAEELGEISRLTNDGRCILPMFAPGDSLIYFERLLVSSPDDTTGRTPEELVKQFGMRIADGELYTLSANYEYPFLSKSQEEITERPGETIVLAVDSPDGKSVVYETTVGNSPESHTVYLVKGDSTVQLSFGNKPCFIGRFSNTGKYLCLIYGTSSAFLVLIDMETNQGYRVANDSVSFDYLPAFSSDDKMMLFLRSDKEYSIGSNFFGDIWIFKFTDLTTIK